MIKYVPVPDASWSPRQQSHIAPLKPLRSLDDLNAAGFSASVRRTSIVASSSSGKTSPAMRLSSVVVGLLAWSMSLLLTSTAVAAVAGFLVGWFAAAWALRFLLDAALAMNEGK